MTKRLLKNIGVSIRARLLTISKRDHIDYHTLLVRYIIERFLWRLSISEHRADFFLKGAALFTVSNIPQRPTKDLDLLGHGRSGVEDVLETIKRVCALPGEDGIVFHLETATSRRIREDEEYQGVRVEVDTQLDTIRVGLQIDVGFGDAVTPGPREVTYPTILPMPAPMVLAYPLESVVAEKFEAMVKLKLLNSRLKDFYDVYTIACTTSFEEKQLRSAIRTTFTRRATAVPMTAPVALTETFSGSSDKIKQWTAFLKRNKLEAPDLAEVVAVNRSMVWPVVEGMNAGEEGNRVWTPTRWT